MQRNTKTLRWAGGILLCGVLLSVVGKFIVSDELVVTIGGGMVGFSWLLFLLGLHYYFRDPEETRPSGAQQGTKQADVESAREPISNWRRVIAWLAAVPSALIGLGWLSIYGVLPELPKGPVDQEFLQVSFYYFSAVAIIGSIAYSVVLAIDIPRIFEWLKEKH